MIWVNTFADKQCNFHIGNGPQMRFVCVSAKKILAYAWRFFVLSDVLNYHHGDITWIRVESIQ